MTKTKWPTVLYKRLDVLAGKALWPTSHLMEELPEYRV